MVYTVVTKDWDRMTSLYKQGKKTAAMTTNLKDYSKGIARYVCGCILWGITVEGAKSGTEVYSDIYAKLKSLASKTSDVVQDIEDTYTEKMKRINKDKFSYATPEFNKNYYRMTKAAVSVDLSLFDPLNDD